MIACSRAHLLACLFARVLAGSWRSGRLARGGRAAHALFIIQTKHPHLGPPSPFFYIIIKSQGGLDLIRGYTVYIRFLVWGVGLGVGLAWFVLVLCFCPFYPSFNMFLGNPCMGAPCGSSGRGWFEVGLAWFVVGFDLGF